MCVSSAAGFTGLWTALSIKRLAPATDVVLVEREYCGAGASGRNGGWVNGWDDILPKLVSRFGRDAALWLVDASRRSLDDIRDTVRDGAIDCDLSFEGGLTVALSPAQVDGILEAALLARELGRDDFFRVLGKDEAVALSGSPAAEAGALILHAGSVQPALLVQGLRRLVAAAGVRIYEATPMVGLQRTLPAVVKTPSGSVTADKIVLASGARLALVPELRRTVFIIPSHVVATASSRDVLDRLGWVTGRPYSTGAPPCTTRSAPRTTASSSAAAAAASAMAATSSRPTTTTPERQRRSSVTCARCCRPRGTSRSSGAGAGRWSAPSTASPGSAPSASTATSTTAWATAGNGVSASNLIGRTLASLALGVEDDHAQSPLVSEPPTYLPPEPIRSAGARAVRSAIERCEVLEDEGRKPDPVSRALRRCLTISMPKGVTLWRRDEMD